MTQRRRSRSKLLSGQSVTFLTSQVGARSSQLWSERLGVAGLQVRPAMLLWNVASVEGRTQQELAKALRLPASRVVDLVDALEAQGHLERRVKASDRRARQLYVTESGRQMLDQIMTIAAEHEEQFTAGLTPSEQAMLIKLLSKVATDRGLASRVHPEF